MLYIILFSVCIIGLVAHAIYVTITDKYRFIDWCITCTFTIVPIICVVDWVFC